MKPLEITPEARKEMRLRFAKRTFVDSNPSLDSYYVDATNGDDANIGSQASPWKTVSKANGANLLPGNSVFLKRGETFEGVLTIASSGTAGSKITISAYGSGDDPILRAASLEGDYITVDSIDFDNDNQSPGLQARVVHVRGNNVIIQNSTVHNGIVDGIDIRGGATDFTIDNVEIYHLLAGSYGSGNDAHGIGVRAGAGNQIEGIINNTNIHEVSGDCLQTDPDRSAAGTISINGSGNTWWTQPLAANFNAGWQAGQSPGENAVDTKMGTDGDIELSFTDTTMYGFTSQVGGVNNRAALNLKETVSAVFDRLTVYDCEIAFRLRGDTGNGNPNITIQNAVVYDCEKAIRAEDSLNNLKVYNSTFGDGITTFLQEVTGGINTGQDLRNNAFLGTKPSAFSDTTNVSATAADFVDSTTDDYRLAQGSTLIDSGATIAAVSVDRLGVSRVGAYEVGAYDGFVSTVGLADVYSLWASDPAFWVGSRMNDLDDIDSIAVNNYETIRTPNAKGIYNWIDTDLDAMGYRIESGSLVGGEQLRLSVPTIGPSTAQMATVVIEFLPDPDYQLFAKQYQFAGGGGSIQFEVNPRTLSDLDGNNTEDPDFPWVSVPQIRLYNNRDYDEGSYNQEATDTSDPGDSSSKYDVQPPLNAPHRLHRWWYYRDHVGQGPSTETWKGIPVEGFVVRPGQWYRYIFTLDWRDPADHKRWGWIESEDTPLTLWFGDKDGDGYSIKWTNSDDNLLTEFWLEFNASGSGVLQPIEFYHRRFFVLKDVFGTDVLSGP